LKNYFLLPFLISVWCISFLTPQSTNYYENSHAVVIGINNYQSENINDLGYAVEDAKSIAELLKSKFNFPEDNVHLILDENATRDYIKDKLYTIVMNANENDRIIVFYAGHGETIKIKSGGEIGYLIPVDGNPDNLYVTGISMRDFKEISEITSAKHVLYMIDACYGGLMALGTRSLKKTDFDDDEKYIIKVTNESARQIITAGGKGDKSQERAIWGHSAFTKELLTGMNDGLADLDQDGYITADELGSFLSKKVYITSEESQTPIKGRYGSGEGEMVFVNPAYIEDKVEEKVEEVITNSQMNIIDNSQVERSFSELQNTLNLMVNRIQDRGESISTFDGHEEYLDSNFVDQWNDGATISNSIFRKIYQFYIDYKNLRLSYSLDGTIDANRVSGFILGPKFTLSQLMPISIKIEYLPSYSFATKEVFQSLFVKRHPWGQKKQAIIFEYHDNISSNDNWLRYGGFNILSTIHYGKDYKDYFRNKGFKLKQVLHT